MEINLIEEIKSLNQTVIKRLFHIKKVACFNNRPKPLQMGILKYILEHPNDKICQHDLEKNFQISKSAISGVLNTMEKNNLIARIPSEEDSRKKYIIPTENSIEMNKELTNGINKVNEELLNCLTEKETKEFLRITNKLKKYMKEGI